MTKMTRFSMFLHPKDAVRTFYETWSGLIGADYAGRQRRQLVRMMIATLVMWIGCVIGFGLAITLGLAEQSLDAALAGMITGAVVVVVGYALLRVAVFKRNRMLAEQAEIVLRIDPKRTEAEAHLLVTRPTLTQQWLQLHPDAFRNESDAK
ncbi:hypothetical protein [Galbitalea soli]|uniref:Uncharacterized protein n=1 Tax=Galbitalea soli TaxID=1268042 RepID=A0A7C9PMP8_9MICO|nr:hypothetical protein [Galbitalea soli]NEM90889.1 hypothetical protein [Galbitalea soli]NYJ31610.1 Na+/melibiose symporter-like transporter [Galbitalea soli]